MPLGDLQPIPFNLTTKVTFLTAKEFDPKFNFGDEDRR
jgi:hypothetical protein